MSTSSEHGGAAAAAASALLSLAAPAFYSLHQPPLPLQRGKRCLLAPETLWLLAGGWEKDQHDGCWGRIIPRQPNFGPSAELSRGWSPRNRFKVMRASQTAAGKASGGLPPTAGQPAHTCLPGTHEDRRLRGATVGPGSSS